MNKLPSMISFDAARVAEAVAGAASSALAVLVGLLASPSPEVRLRAATAIVEAHADLQALRGAK